MWFISLLLDDHIPSEVLLILLKLVIILFDIVVLFLALRLVQYFLLLHSFPCVFSFLRET